MLFSAWLNAPAVCEAPQSCNRGTHLAAKQKFTIEFQSSDGTDDAHAIAKKWTNKGNALIKKGSYDKAIEAYKKAIDIDPGYAKAWCGRGRAYKKLGYNGLALEDFAKSKELGYKC